MITSIEFKKDFRTFKNGEKFEFKPGINVLVGDQGSGKSTLIELLRCKFETNKSFKSNDSSYRAKSIGITNKIEDIISITYDEKPLVYGFDFERESPRDTSAIHFDMMSEQMFAMKASHGEGNIVALDKVMKTISKDKDNYNIILLDEPDASLSPRNCYQLLSLLKACQDQWKKQLIISAHNPIIIYGKHPLMKDKGPYWKEILSLEHKRWITPESFMLDQLLPSDKKIK